MDSVEGAVVVGLIFAAYVLWRQVAGSGSVDEFEDDWSKAASGLGLSVCKTGSNGRLEMEGHTGGVFVTARMKVRTEKERVDSLSGKRRQPVVYCDTAVLADLQVPWNEGLELESKSVDKIPDDGARATENYAIAGELRIGTDFPKIAETIEVDDTAHRQVRSLANKATTLFVQEGQLQVICARKPPGPDGDRIGFFKTQIESAARVAHTLGDSQLSLKLSELPRDLPILLRVRGEDDTNNRRSLAVIVEVELSDRWSGHPPLESQSDHSVPPQMDVEQAFDEMFGPSDSTANTDDPRWNEDRIRLQLLELLESFDTIKVCEQILRVESRYSIADGENWIDVADDAVELAGGAAIELNKAVESG